MKMTEKTAEKPRLEKVGECLYRYSSNGVYYALLKHRGKQKKCSLETTDRATANRKLAEKRKGLGWLDPAAGRITLKDLCERYLATVRHQKARTVRRKEDIVKRLLESFPDGATCQVSKIRKSSIEAWVAGYEFSYASYNLYIQCIKAIFDLAVNDKILVESPAALIKCKKVVKPVRITPSFEEFHQIIHEVRGQTFNADAEDSAQFLEFMGLAGVGQAEIANLTRDDIDLANERIRLYRAKTSTPYYIPLFPQLMPLLGRLKIESMQREQKIFVIKDGKKALSGACRRLGLPNFTQRSLRRMFITRCIELGIDVKVVAEWQGHRDGGKLILATYSHVRKTHADEMAKRLQLPTAPEGTILVSPPETSAKRKKPDEIGQLAISQIARRHS